MGVVGISPRCLPSTTLHTPSRLYLLSSFWWKYPDCHQPTPATVGHQGHPSLHTGAPWPKLGHQNLSPTWFWVWMDSWGQVCPICCSWHHLPPHLTPGSHLLWQLLVSFSSGSLSCYLAFQSVWVFFSCFPQLISVACTQLQQIKSPFQKQDAIQKCVLCILLPPAAARKWKSQGPAVASPRLGG